MIKKWKITVPELTGRKRRNAYIYVPDEFAENPEARYPVLYMFDGHNVFFDKDATYGKSWGMAEFVKATNLPIIIAAVECDTSPTNGRLSEYSPFTFRSPHFGYVQGRGHTTMEWLVNRFKPYIDSRYPTLPQREFTFIAGSSMGGLMSLYAVTAYNHVFSRCAALSPSLWVAPSRMDQLLRTTPLADDTVIYMDYGSVELAQHRNMNHYLSRVSMRLLERNIMLTCRIIPGGNHSEASWEQQIPFFMETLLYGLE